MQSFMLLYCLIAFFCLFSFLLGSLPFVRNPVFSFLKGFLCLFIIHKVLSQNYLVNEYEPFLFFPCSFFILGELYSPLQKDPSKTSGFSAFLGALLSILPFLALILILFYAALRVTVRRHPVLRLIGISVLMLWGARFFELKWIQIFPVLFILIILIFRQHRLVRRGLLVLPFLILNLLFTSPSFANEIKDFRNKIFHIQKPPSRIVTLMPNLAEALVEMGSAASLVGVSDYTSLPPGHLAKKLGPYHRISAEAVYALNPDLVLASMDGNDQSLIEKLESLGTKVMVLNTDSIDHLLQTLETLNLVSKNQNNQKKIEHLRESLKPSAQLGKKIFVQIGWDPLVTVSSKTYIGELFYNLGLENIFHKDQIKYPKPNIEEIIARNPDIILICKLTSDNTEVNRALNYWKKFTKITAVKNNALYVLQEGLLTKPGFNLIEAVQYLRQNLKLSHAE